MQSLKLDAMQMDDASGRQVFLRSNVMSSTRQIRVRLSSSKVDNIRVDVYTNTYVIISIDHYDTVYSVRLCKFVFCTRILEITSTSEQVT